jgi:hypothetical protein
MASWLSFLLRASTLLYSLMSSRKVWVWGAGASEVRNVGKGNGIHRICVVVGTAADRSLCFQGTACLGTPLALGVV